LAVVLKVPLHVRAARRQQVRRIDQLPAQDVVAVARQRDRREDADDRDDDHHLDQRETPGRRAPAPRRLVVEVSVELHGSCRSVG